MYNNYHDIVIKLEPISKQLSDENSRLKAELEELSSSCVHRAATQNTRLEAKQEELSVLSDHRCILLSKYKLESFWEITVSEG